MFMRDLGFLKMLLGQNCLEHYNVEHVRVVKNDNEKGKDGIDIDVDI